MKCDYDGDSMSRQFACRLASTPDLTYLSAQDMMSLRGEFRLFGDDGSVDDSGGC